MPYSSIISLKLARAEAVVLRDFMADAAVLAEAQKTNPALSLILQDLVAQFECELVEHHRPDYATVLEKMKSDVLELEVIGIPKDIALRIRRDFSKSEHAGVIAKMRELKSPRLMRCAVHIAAGSAKVISHATTMANDDYRDLVMAAEYDRFSVRLFDFNRPFDEAAIPAPK